jgi:heat shock protein HtpX
MAVDFQQLISTNRRNSWLLIIIFAVFVGVVSGVLGYGYGYYAMGPRLASQYVLLIGGVGVLIALISSIGSYFGGASAILSVSGAKEIQKSDDPQLYNVVEEMAIAAGVPMPKVYLIEDTAPNAFATGRDPEHGIVAVTTGLRDKLNREELQGVIAHEMSHIRNYDIRFALLMTALVGVIALLCDMFQHALRWGYYGGDWGSQRRDRDRSERDGKSDSSGLIGLVMMVAAIILAILAPIIAKMIEMAFSRQREYLADASAIDLTRNPQGLANALVKISNDPEVLEIANRATAPLYIVHPIKNFEARASTMFDSHPPIKDRVSRLLSMNS